MNLLFVNACVREESRTERLARAYLEKVCPDAEIREIRLETCADLVPLNEERLNRRNEDIRQGDYSDPIYRYARDFAAADRIVIAAPYWDCTYPALLKLYIENICVSGVTFGYGSDGNLMRLCRADKLVYVATAGGPLRPENALTASIRELAWLYCIPETEFVTADCLDLSGSDPEAILDARISRLEKIADPV